MALMRGLLLSFLVLILEYILTNGEEPKLPLGMSKELYCEGCEAAIKEMDKNLSKNAIDSIMIRIVEGMETVCSPRILVVYKWSPPKMAKACLHFISSYDEDLEDKLYEQYKKPGRPVLSTKEFVDEVCTTWTGACNDVDRDYQPDENVDGPEGEGLESQGMAGPIDKDGIRQMNTGGDGDETEYEDVSESEWETDDEGEDPDAGTGKEKLVPRKVREKFEGGPKRNDTSKQQEQKEQRKQQQQPAGGANATGKENLKPAEKNIIDDEDENKTKTRPTAKTESKKKVKDDDVDDDEEEDDSDDERTKTRRRRVPDSPENTAWTEEEKRKRKEANYIDDDDEDDNKMKTKKNATAKDEL